jgi:hypothetical protein
MVWWYGALLENLLVSQHVSKLLVSYRTRRSYTVTTALQIVT